MQLLDTDIILESLCKNVKPSVTQEQSILIITYSTI